MGMPMRRKHALAGPVITPAEAADDALSSNGFCSGPSTRTAGTTAGIATACWPSPAMMPSAAAPALSGVAADVLLDALHPGEHEHCDQRSQHHDEVLPQAGGDTKRGRHP